MSREQLLLPTETTHPTKIPLRFITTYSKTIPNFKEIISKHWSYLERSSAIRELSKQDFMITYRKPPSLKVMLVRARISQPTTPFSKGCSRPHTCTYCGRISQSGHIKNLQHAKKRHLPNNNPIYCLECNWCHIKYVGQTKI